MQIKTIVILALDEKGYKCGPKEGYHETLQTLHHPRKSVDK